MSVVGHVPNGSHPNPAETDAVLVAHGIVKEFGHVKALRGADIEVRAGELVGLVGDNGAGKSTLVNVLSGAINPDAGTIRLGGKELRLTSPAHARRLGIEAVYQSLALVPDLDSAENLFLGRDLRRPGLLGRLGVVDRGRMRTEAADHFARLGVPMPSVTVPISSLSGGQRQMVAVARAAAFTGRVVFLDEPTAALAAEPARHVMELIRRIRDAGVAIVLISHDLTRVFEVADRIIIMRLGRVVGDVKPADSHVDEVVALMTGAKTSPAYQPAPPA
jgi:simple sugar transport system ATP-binding protein